MEEQTSMVAEVMVVSAMSFKEPAQILEHFLYLADAVRGLTDEIVYEAIRKLQDQLGDRMLLGTELCSVLCKQGEKGVVVTSRVERVLKQYAKFLKELIYHSEVFGYMISFSEDDYKLALNIAQVLAKSTSRDSAGTISDLIRTIATKTSQEVLEEKIQQLESPDFYEKRPKDRARFYDVLVIEYLKRFSDMWEVMKRLRQPERVSSQIQASGGDLSHHG